MKKVLLFIGFSILSCLICFGFSCILDLPFDSRLLGLLLYLLTLGYCYVFFKHRPAICNIFVLPAGFVLLTASMCTFWWFMALNIPYDPSDMMGGAIYFMMAVALTTMYTGPFFVLTLIIAAIIWWYNKKKTEKTNLL